MRTIDADALLQVPNVRKVTEYDESGCGMDYNAVPVEAIQNAPTVEYYGKFDVLANGLFDVATRQDKLLFRETDEMCPVCQRDLEVYYCENRTYTVRCKYCNIVTLVSAKNPGEAAAKVGLHVKPVRHGRWTFPWTSPECSVCRKTQKWTSKFCPNCGAKMDAEG